jgi:putative glutamine amidotransferase
LQIANVYFGGTLVPDIPTFGKFNHSKVSGYDLYHAVSVDPNSMLRKIVNAVSGEINSAHHQSAEMVAPDLVTNAITIDGVIEGLERLHPEGKAYLQLVQWHPERMRDIESSFTKSIKKSFLDAVKQ